MKPFTLCARFRNTNYVSRDPGQPGGWWRCDLEDMGRRAADVVG